MTAATIIEHRFEHFPARKTAAENISTARRTIRIIPIKISVILFHSFESCCFHKILPACPGFKSGAGNQNHQLSWWYAPALEGHITGSPIRGSEKFANRIYFTGRR
jgi:hypothetical protein